MKYMVLFLLISCKYPRPRYKQEPVYKTVIKIESCANSGRCRVIFDDNSSDLILNPHIGMKVLK